MGGHLSLVLGGHSNYCIFHYFFLRQLAESYWKYWGGMTMVFIFAFQWLCDPSVLIWRNLHPGTVTVAGGSEDAGGTVESG